MAWISRGTGYYTVFPLPRASYFLVFPPEDCRGNIVGPDGAQKKSMKQEGRGQGKTFERMNGTEPNWCSEIFSSVNFWMYTFIQVDSSLRIFEDLCAKPNNTSDKNVFKMCDYCSISTLSFFTDFKYFIKYYWVRDHAGHQMVQNDLFPWFQKESQFLSLSLQNMKDKRDLEVHLVQIHS